MSLPDVAMVFAAGFGTRMGALTKDVPKPLLRAGGATLLDHALDRLARGGVSRAVINTHYHADQVAQAVAHRSAPAVHLSYEPDILETGGGMRVALPHLSDPVISVNPDAIWAATADPLSVLKQAWRPQMQALLLLVPVAQCRAYSRAGDFDLAADSQLIRRGAAPAAPYVYSGWQILRTERLHDVAEEKFSLNVVWNAMNAAGGLFGVICDQPWVDVGTPAGLQAADQILSEGE
ncbi:MurNAc alpha-1-phosphate uridylyltransferase [Monaibacterium marinum]|uniref:MurNAc alpha-1-phosphate uridylyltransferase n=1 Tax=Pontivivens marinum TaxID=1690039 RepID=A0A2C9CNA9_9RHOB|nr:nucleotidyltransferase family protein [Monaibacterium marinum]SOH92680.1 MurNAc alpha-1-phosphate uridylyltransferase [Monaibacterium marinum]